jgi:urease accessory protein
VTAGTVTDLASLEAFLRGRLRTAGLVAAAIAAAACTHSTGGRHGLPGNAALGMHDPAHEHPAADERRPGERNAPSATADPAHEHPAADERRDGDGDTGRENWDQRLVHPDGFWGEIDAEADARTPSPAQRGASRRQGRALLRAARIAWPEDRGLAGLAAVGAAVASGAVNVAEASKGSAGGPGHAVGRGAASARVTASGADAEYRGGPHHAVVLGAAAAAAGCDVVEAARIAAYQSVAGPASAAVRLLAFDPMRATAVLVRLSRDIDLIAERAAAASGGPLEELPCPSAPALDLLAEAHIRAEVRLFES